MGKKSHQNCNEGNKLKFQNTQKNTEFNENSIEKKMKKKHE